MMDSDYVPPLLSFTLGKECQFLFKIILIQTVNTYVINIAPLIRSTLASEGNTGMLFSMSRFIYDMVWNA